jgi:hypothetical protein
MAQSREGTGMGPRVGCGVHTSACPSAHFSGRATWLGYNRATPAAIPWSSASTYIGSLFIVVDMVNVPS